MPDIRDGHSASQRAFLGIPALSGWTSGQRHVVAASFLGWTLDAFDFFVLKDIAAEFHTDISNVTFAILLIAKAAPAPAE